jgi:hypothetical protein
MKLPDGSLHSSPVIPGRSNAAKNPYPRIEVIGSGLSAFGLAPE